ncbi:MAG: ethanolamine utilization protein EutN [Acidobacteria bacterium]|nr:ethanolamine utilization protein EutN [Acidobacteriota bacterium]MYD72504.1 ethanolamine utilization protein EutN [Acidobacteriota bacterium]MYJ05018.1 ethanolamine utilization protein EutN [Acidobacteriota bacterium]
MHLARVIGDVVSTLKDASLEGQKLLLVQPVAPSDEPVGAPMVAIDAAQAGVGELVLVVREGRAAVAAVRRSAAPVEVAIVGVVDSVHMAPGSDR